MKKVALLLLATVMCLSLVLGGCGSKNELTDAQMAEYTQLQAEAQAQSQAEWLKTDEEGEDAVRDINLIPQNDYQAWLAVQAQSNKNNSVVTFELSGVTSITGDDIKIVKRDVVPVAHVERPKTWKDVIDHSIDPLFNVAALGLKVWGILEFTDTIVDGINEDPLVVEQNNETVQVVEVPEIEVIEVPDPYEVPSDPIIIEVPGETVIWTPPPTDGPIDLNLSGELDVNVGPQTP